MNELNVSKLDETKLDGQTNLKLKLDEYIKKRNKDPDHDWIRFYQFKHVKLTALITKAKIYQTALVLVVFLNSLNDYLKTGNDFESFINVNSFMCFSLLLLAVMGNISQRIIGIAYYDLNKPDIIRISHLTFFGRRQNTILKLNDISPLSDSNASTKGVLFFKLICHINNKPKTLFLANGSLAEIDDKIYQKIFGTLK